MELKEVPEMPDPQPWMRELIRKRIEEEGAEEAVITYAKAAFRVGYMDALLNKSAPSPVAPE